MILKIQSDPGKKIMLELCPLARHKKTTQPHQISAATRQDLGKNLWKSNACCWSTYFKPDPGWTYCCFQGTRGGRSLSLWERFAQINNAVFFTPRREPTTIGYQDQQLVKVALGQRLPRRAVVSRRCCSRPARWRFTIKHLKWSWKSTWEGLVSRRQM